MILIFRFFFNILILIFFLICQTHEFNLTQPDPCGLGWVEFFLTHHGGLGRVEGFGQKIPSNPTRPNPCTPSKTSCHSSFYQPPWLLSTLFFWQINLYAEMCSQLKISLDCWQLWIALSLSWAFVYSYLEGM